MTQFGCASLCGNVKPWGTLSLVSLYSAMWRSRESTSLLAMWPRLLGFTGVDVIYVRLARMTNDCGTTARQVISRLSWLSVVTSFP